jgi:mRNA interferase MazF
VKRGEIWTVAGGPDYAGKPRPAVVIQDDQFAGTLSVTICAFTSEPDGEDIVRLFVVPTETNGLREPSRLMADKITTVPRSKIGRRIGRLADEDMARLGNGIVLFLGLAR